MLVLELTSLTAAKIAGKADLPMTESTGKRAPNFTTFGLEETMEFTLVAEEGSFLPITSKGIHKHKTKRNNVFPITMLPRGPSFVSNFRLQFFSLYHHSAERTKNQSCCKTISGTAEKISISKHHHIWNNKEEQLILHEPKDSIHVLGGLAYKTRIPHSTRKVPCPYFW